MWKADHSTLHLTNPYMHGEDVGQAQTLLNRSHHYGIEIDKVFGPETALAAEHEKWKIGYPERRCLPSFGSVLHNYLTGDVPLPQDYHVRAQSRARVFAADQARRKMVLEYVKWGVGHEAQIHYAQERPMDLMSDLFRLPVRNDCSEFLTKAYKYGDMYDPNGYAYNGYGNTDTMLHHMRHITKSQLRIADLVVYGNYPSHHVCIVVELGEDPLLGSHGMERGPVLVRHSVEWGYQNHRPVNWLTLP